MYMLWASWFQRRFFKFFFHYKSVGANDPWDVANLDPRCMAGSINVGDHLTSLLLNLLALSLMVSEKKIFKGSLAI